MSTEQIENPAAFPFSGCSNGLIGEEYAFVPGSEGMSLRDYFAAAALPTCIDKVVKDLSQIGLFKSQSAKDELGNLIAPLAANFAFMVADEMLKARVRKAIGKEVSK